MVHVCTCSLTFMKEMMCVYCAIVLLIYLLYYYLVMCSMHNKITQIKGSQTTMSLICLCHITSTTVGADRLEQLPTSFAFDENMI